MGKCSIVWFMSESINALATRRFEDDFSTHDIDQERLIRDTVLTERVRAGFTPAEPSPENTRPLVVDGQLDDDATLALGELWQSYLPATFSVLRKFMDKGKPGYDRDDLTQEAFLAMLHSSLKWDPNGRITFLTHYRHMAFNYMNRYTQNTRSTVRIPVHEREKITKLNSVLWSVYGRDGHLPYKRHLEEALADQMGSIDDHFFADDRDKHSIFGRARDAKMHPIDPSASEQAEVEQEIMLSDLQGVMQNLVRAGALRERSLLSQREIDVLRMRFFEKKNLEEIAKVFGITRESVRQIESKVLAKLRHGEVSDYLRGFTDEEE